MRFLEVEDDLIVAAGTIFSCIIIWSVKKNAGKIINKLEGHQGSIFRLCWNEKNRFLASASDDRRLLIL